MQTKYMKYVKRTFVFAILCTVLAGTMLTSSCNKEEGNNGLTVLNSFGPMPVARGAELRFIGENLDKITAIVLPGNIEIAAADFTSKSATLITITVPQNAVEGLIVLKAPQGDITTKTELGFSEPIILTSFTPATIKFDEVITLTGDYLNLINEVIFTDRVSVLKAAFISQSRTELKLKVPAAAQTGKIAVSNGADDPIIIYSTSDLTVTLPGLTSMAPNPVKAGTTLTITGTNLDLVKSVIFGGNKSVTTFTSQALTQIVLTVPVDAQDDTLKIIPASGVVVKSTVPLVMVVPTVNVTPTSVKNEADITVTGTNLDLIDQVIFGGNKQGTINAGGTATQIIVKVPVDAVSGIVDFVTKAAKTVHGPSLTIIDPVFTSFTPSSAAAKTDIVITGTDLDVVTDVVFIGGNKGSIGARSTTQITVTVPVGAKTGKITLVTLNGSQIQSSTDFTVLANLPNITSFSEPKGTPGQILTLNGTNLSLIKELIFPGNITATAYGTKTDTKVEVYVPINTTLGYGYISIITYEGDEGLTPQIFFGGTDPILDQTLVYFNFDGKNSWWGDIGAPENLPEYSLDGNYFRVNGGPYAGWKGLFWRNGGNDFPGNIIGTNVNDYSMKFDVNVIDAVSDPKGVIAIRLKGSEGDFWYNWAPWKTTPFKTVGWITVTVPISAFADGTKHITDLSKIDSDFGMAWNNSDGSNLNICIDNLRFDKN
ncbi:MAG: glycan-binding surface protein [Lentimicrobiaceae bacterium]